MLNHRVIPALLLRGEGLVKTVRFRNAKYVGDPINAIRIFNEKEVDELMVLDIDASRMGHAPNYKLIEEFASECFMPIGYGGGIKDITQARQLFNIGIEKIILQSAVLDNPGLITEIASRFGNQSIVLSIDIKKNWLGKYKIWSSASRRNLPGDWLAVLKELTSAGAGEVLLNAVDQDGMQNGYDLGLIRTASSAIDVPLVALGGAGNIQHFKEAVEAGASAVAAGSLFVFQGPHKAVLISYFDYSTLETLFRNQDET